MNKSLKICLWEACNPCDRGSIGANNVLLSAKNAGFDVEYIMPESTDKYDIELVSVHHGGDYIRLNKIPRKAPIRIIGGHSINNNPKPILHLGDVFCIGEGEEWIVDILTRLSNGAQFRDLIEVKGTYIPSLMDSESRILTTFCKEIPKFPAYLNKSTVAGHDDTWYIELARGCLSKCHYCELGWSVPHRRQDYSHIVKSLNEIDASICNKVTLFAPDESDYPQYPELIKQIYDMGLTTSFGSMRIDSFINNNPNTKKNFLMRVGIDGLSERIRYRVKKNISNQNILDFFRKLSEIGHTNVKLFNVICYPFETSEDVEEWLWLLGEIRKITRHGASAHVRVKYTPFIPQISTPLGGLLPAYSHKTVMAITQWHRKFNKPARTPSVYYEMDGCIMSEKTHAIQCALSMSDERIAPYLGSEDEIYRWWKNNQHATLPLGKHQTIRGGVIPIENLRDKFSRCPD